MPEEVQDDEPVTIRRDFDGRVPAPHRLFLYEGQAIVRTRTGTHQCWPNEDSDGPVFPLKLEEDWGQRDSIKTVRNDHLDENQFSIYYVESEDEEPVLYEVIDRDDE